MNNNITNNTQNNNNQKIQINNFGEENISYLTSDTYKELLTDPRNSISKLIDEIHFNKKYQENSNIRIPNKKQQFAEIFKDQK